MLSSLNYQVDKATKEEKAFELHLKELEATDRDLTQQMMKFMLVLFATVFSVILAIANHSDNVVALKLLLTALILILTLMAIYTWIQVQQTRYISDCYRALQHALAKDRLLTYSLLELSLISLIWYKRQSH